MTTANDAGDDDAVRAEDSTAALSPPDDDTFELEVDGQVHTVPAALKGVPTVLLNCHDTASPAPAIVPSEVAGGHAATGAWPAGGALW